MQNDDIKGQLYRDWGFIMALTGAYLELAELLVSKGILSKEELGARLSKIEEQLRNGDTAAGADWARITRENLT